MAWYDLKTNELVADYDVEDYISEVWTMDEHKKYLKECGCKQGEERHPRPEHIIGRGKHQTEGDSGKRKGKGPQPHCRDTRRELIHKTRI